MARRLDEIVIIDVEATCWDDPPPPGQTQDIIEIGVCVVETASLVRRGRDSLIVRPTSSTVSPYCTALTTLTPGEVATGLSFGEACEVLAGRHGTRARVWASWGDFDRRLFDEQCAREGVPVPFGDTHLDVKHLFALVHALPQETGMMEALRAAGLPHEGTHHRGGDDAWNIAALLISLIRAARHGFAAAIRS
jgi:inhibitor of KinA sporulation pathway (predicted exonuclease)